MCQPFAFRDFHVCKSSLKGRIFRTAGINAKVYCSIAIPHMANSHLLENNTIIGTFDAIIIIPPAKTIPHGFLICSNLSCCPIRVSMIRHHTSKVLEHFVFVFDRSFEPIFAVQVHHDSALVKSLLAFEFRFDDKREKLLICLHLQYGCIIISEVIKCSLPQIRMGRSNNLDFI